MTITLTDDQRAQMKDLSESDAELLIRTKQNQEIRNRLFTRIVKGQGGNWNYDDAAGTMTNGKEKDNE